MTVRGSHKVPGAPEQVYDLLWNVSVLQTAIPGCKELVALGNGKYAMKMKVALAALVDDFAGTVQLMDGDPPNKFTMVVEGTGRIGYLKGQGLLTLIPDGESTAVAYDGTVQIGGTMASVGQRLLDATSKMMIRMFFDRFSRAAASAPQEEAASLEKAP